MWGLVVLSINKQLELSVSIIQASMILFQLTGSVHRPGSLDHIPGPSLPSPLLHASRSTPHCGPRTPRFLFVLDGMVEVTADGKTVELRADDYAYLPAGLDHSVRSAAGAGLLLFERRYALQVRWARLE